jgi:hypothetical protein
MIARGGAATLALGMIVAVGIAAVGVFRARVSTSAPPVSIAGSGTAGASTDSTAGVEGGAVTAQPTGLDATPVSQVAQGAGAASDPVPITRALTPVIPVGRTMLRDTMVAERIGDTVRVSFDLLLSRTRRPDKFEAIMRATLPQVYGAAADSALRSLPLGSVARAGDLLATLPERGLRIQAGDGTTIAVWPETRAGRDGPLVVAYRVLASH